MIAKKDLYFWFYNELQSVFKHMKHVPLKTIQLKNHPELSERWLQDIIADDPSIIGIGDVILKDKERIHHHAGR